MQKKTELKLEGLIVPMATPFRENEDLDEERLRSFTNWLIEEGVHGLYPISGCGEAPKLTLQEKRRMIEIVIEEARGRVPVLPCTAHGSLRETLGLTKYAKEKGVDGVVLIPPSFWWLKLSDEDILFNYFNRICSEVDIPVMVYDNAYPISLRLVERLAKIRNIVALKDSSNDFMKLVAEIALLKDEIGIFPGEEHMLLPSLMLGASGTVCSGLNVYPRLMLNIYNMFKEGRLREALEMHESLVSLWNFIYEYDEHHAVKEALALIGMPIGAPRAPYLRPPLSREKKRELRKLLASVGLIT